jgi:hypothetical protein
MKTEKLDLALVCDILVNQFDHMTLDETVSEIIGSSKNEEFIQKTEALVKTWAETDSQKYWSEQDPTISEPELKKLVGKYLGSYLS